MAKNGYYPSGNLYKVLYKQAKVALDSFVTGRHMRSNGSQKSGGVVVQKLKPKCDM